MNPSKSDPSFKFNPYLEYLKRKKTFEISYSGIYTILKAIYPQRRGCPRPQIKSTNKNEF